MNKTFRVTVELYDGTVVHDRITTFRAQYSRTMNASHTRLINRLQRIWPEWKRINIEPVKE